MLEASRQWLGLRVRSASLTTPNNAVTCQIEDGAVVAQRWGLTMDDLESRDKDLLRKDQSLPHKMMPCCRKTELGTVSLIDSN